MPERVYIETSVVSYLAARPSGDLVVAAHQKVTWEWWTTRRPRFDLYVSQAVVREAMAGHRDAARQRMGYLEGMPVLGITPPAESPALALVRSRLLPERAAGDALHLALASVHGMDYLLTWNCRHLANAQLIRPVVRFMRGKGLAAPLVCTPEELMGY